MKILKDFFYLCKIDKNSSKNNNSILTSLHVFTIKYSQLRSLMVNKFIQNHISMKIYSKSGKFYQENTIFLQKINYFHIQQ